MAIKKTTDVEPRSTPLEAGEPVEVPALSQMGSTFAERAAAASKKAGRKQVDAAQAEDKSVSSAQTKGKKK